MKRRKKSLIFGIILLILCFGIGYAYLTTTLSINGTTDIDMNNWDVYFDNIQVTSGSVSGAQVIDAAEVVDDTTVSFHINLKEPGDFYEFTVDAKNDGTIDAMISSITKKVNGGTTIPVYLNYTVTYADGFEIENNHLLDAESLETYKVRVEYRSDINPSDLPSTAQSLTLSFAVEYVQADSNAQEVEGRVLTRYTISTITMQIGSPVPDGVTLYKTPEAAMAAFSNRTFYLKHTIQNGIVLDTVLEFVITDDLANLYPDLTPGTYNLMGGSSIDFYDTIHTLVLAFGETNCEIASNTYCIVSDTYAGGSFAHFVYAGIGDWGCQIDPDKSSYCFLNIGD